VGIMSAYVCRCAASTRRVAQVMQLHWAELRCLFLSPYLASTVSLFASLCCSLLICATAPRVGFLLFCWFPFYFFAPHVPRLCTTLSLTRPPFFFLFTKQTCVWCARRCFLLLSCSTPFRCRAFTNPQIGGLMVSALALHPPLPLLLMLLFRLSLRYGIPTYSNHPFATPPPSVFLPLCFNYNGLITLLFFFLVACATLLLFSSRSI
jgi:hypothetical protein